MEKSIGRYLSPNDVIHHKDHNKMNNDIENLLLTDRHSHMNYHEVIRDEKGKVTQVL